MRTLAAFIAASLATVALALIFFTQQVIAKQAAIGVRYTPAQQLQTYVENFLGLAPMYGAVLAVALLVGFLVAAGVKRILTPLAPVAYPVAGAAAVMAALWLIENVVAGGGVGAIGGARDALGMALQGLAGLVGGAVFEALRGRPRAR